MIPHYLNYWFFFSIVNLLYLTYQDYKNNTLVDDRKNWFMLGVTTSLISHVTIGLWYTIALVILSAVLFVYLNKIKALGEADSSTLSWLFLGLGFINVTYLVFFFGILFILTLVYFILYKLLKKTAKVQYYGVILTAFILFWLWVARI